MLDDASLYPWLCRDLAREFYRHQARAGATTSWERVTAFLSDAVARSDDGLVIRCTQEAIADAVGMTMETVNRQLSSLDAAGTIRVGRGTVEVVALDVLDG